MITHQHRCGHPFSRGELRALEQYAGSNQLIAIEMANDPCEKCRRTEHRKEVK